MEAERDPGRLIAPCGVQSDEYSVPGMSQMWNESHRRSDRSGVVAFVVLVLPT
jgi:hypothetical protein